MPIDYSRYPPNWLSEIRPRIMLRANNCCEECGVPHLAVIWRPKRGSAEWLYVEEPEGAGAWDEPPPWVNPTKIVLTIAHLDNDPENWEVKDERLKALCQRCHLKLDLPHHINNRKYGRNWKRDQTSLELE